jgi:starch phosphorylase
MEPRISYISPRLNEEALQHAIAYNLMFILGKDPSLANKHEWLNATLFAVRDRLVERWLRAHRARISQQARRYIICRWSFSSAVPSRMPYCRWASMRM